MSKYCLLTPNKDTKAVLKYYCKDLSVDDCKFLPLFFNPEKKKTPVKEIKQYITDVITPYVKEHQCEYILVCDGEYFKQLSKKSQVLPYLGYVIETELGKVAYVPSYKGALYNEDVPKQIDIAIKAVLAYSSNTYHEPGKNIIKTEVYPSSVEEIKTVLTSLLSCDKLTCDIETWSLKHFNSGLASITFCWSDSEGTAFKIDYSSDKENEPIRDLLRWFFDTYQGSLIFHNITFDMYILTYQLYMKDLLDTEGLLLGLDTLLKNIEDTKIIAYLCTNSCAGNNLGLKHLAQQFAGNYAQENITNIDAIPEEELLRYNLIDGLSTWYVYNKYYPKLIEENQEKIYRELYIPAIKDIIQMQLTGLPLDMDRVLDAEKQMEEIKDRALNKIYSSSLVQSYMDRYKSDWADRKNSILKKKRVTPEDCPNEFNPASGLMLKELLYSYLKLPVIEKTPSKEPATGKDVLDKLLSHTTKEDVKELLHALIEFKEVIKILTAFIPAFKSAVKASDGRYYLYGSQNSTGTVSGRYSANSPNLAQLPSTGTKFAKLIKSCFRPPKGTLFLGIDYSSLEDRISALVTKDSNKLKVYTDHYDGHCLRAYYYYKDQMPDISKEIEEHPENQVEIINSIKSRYKSLRQASKAPTFALTYKGTWLTLQKNCGFTEEEAKRIEKAYHDLYKESDAWSERLLERAEREGFVTGALGLKVRTPALYHSLQGLSVTPKEVEAEGRTAANAAIQSYGMLTARAIKAFMEKVRNSPYRTKIRVCNIIHDAAYFLVDNDADTVLWVNENLVKEFQWQDDPAITHPDVHLGGELSIFHPDWAHEVVIPNECTKEQLFAIADKKEN